jgi:hypothetical protein
VTQADDAEIVVTDAMMAAGRKAFICTPFDVYSHEEIVKIIYIAMVKAQGAPMRWRSVS